MDFEVAVSVRVTNAAGAAFTVVDTQTTSTGDNPRYVADYADAAIADVADRVHATLLNRFGHRPADGHGVGYYPGVDRGKFVRPTVRGDAIRTGVEREATPPQTAGDV